MTMLFCYLKSLDPNFVGNAALSMHTFISRFLLQEFKFYQEERTSMKFPLIYQFLP